MLEITEQEFIDNLDSDDFFRRYGNPVKFNVDGKYLVAMSFELYERLNGAVNLAEGTTVEIEDFLENRKEKTDVSCD